MARSTNQGGIAIATMLIVEDDRLIAVGLQRQLASLGHTVLRPVTSAAVALAAVRVFQPEAVVMDLQLSGDMDGLTAGGLIEAAGIPVIYLSDAPRARLTADHQGPTPRFHLQNPPAEEAVRRILPWALGYGTLQRTLQALRRQVATHHQQRTVLQAQVKALIQQVHELRERLKGRDLPQEEPPAP